MVPVMSKVRAVRSLSWFSSRLIFLSGWPLPLKIVVLRQVVVASVTHFPPSSIKRTFSLSLSSTNMPLLVGAGSDTRRNKKNLMSKMMIRSKNSRLENFDRHPADVIPPKKRSKSSCALQGF